MMFQKLHQFICFCLVAATATPTFAQSSVYDYRSGRTYGAQERDRETNAYGSYRRDEPPEVNIYSPSGEIIDRGRVDANGTVYSDHTGRRIGQWRR